MTTEADYEAVRSPDRLAVLVLGIARSAGTRVHTWPITRLPSPQRHRVGRSGAVRSADERGLSDRQRSGGASIAQLLPPC